MAKKDQISTSEDAILVLGSLRIIYEMLSAKDQLLVEVLEKYQFDSSCHLSRFMESNHVNIKAPRSNSKTVNVIYGKKDNPVKGKLTHHEIRFFRYFFCKKITDGYYPQCN